ncbi:MAG: hypothetical protein AB7F35_01200 [Acetobacteraceae bacterium]
MADISKLKAARGLGDPPTPEEARTDLAQPPPAPPPQPPPPQAHTPANRIDARSLRRSGRTVHFATKVTPEFDNRVRQLAMDRGKMLTEILEEALLAYEKQIGSS